MSHTEEAGTQEDADEAPSERHARAATARHKGCSRFLYDRFAARYDRLLAPLERRLLARLRARTLAALPQGSHLLEIGAGTGLNFPFYPMDASGVASEPSIEMLRRASAKPRPAHILLARHAAERLPYADHAFDAAFATLVFCSVASPAGSFAELRRVVRPGGHLVLLEHVRPPGLLGLLFDALTPITVALFDDHFNRRTADLASRAGLELLRVERHAFGIIQIIVCRV